MSEKDKNIKIPHLLHEMIIALTGINTFLGSKDPMIPDYNKRLLEPTEADLMQRILKFGQYYGEIENYVFSINFKRFKEEEKIGLYLLSFAESLTEVTHPYWNTLVSLEDEITKDQQCSLHFVWSKIYLHIDLLIGLKHIVNKVEHQNLRGCMLLQYLNDELHSSVGVMRSAIQLIIEAINKIFYHQISCWMIYGQLVDTYNEFFIKENTPALGTHWYSPFDRFSLNLLMLPKFVTHSSAEKILNIGQTVQFLRANPYMTTYIDKFDAKTDICITENGIMGAKEKEILKKMQDIQSISIWNEGGIMDKLIAEISSCVTQKLWSLAIEDAKLIDQLRLVKEFFLLGRGELFHEFVRQVDRNYIKGLAASSSINSELNSILQEAIRRILVKEDFFQRFRLEYKKDVSDNKVMGLGGEWSNVTVNYDIPWPLQLLFTPGVLASYNNIFQFLLRLKKIQVKLVNCWVFEKTKTSKQDYKENNNLRRRLLHRNLWFLINNLQYYLHVDVLESQFVIFENALKNSRDFDEIQKAHIIFLENLVGQLFIYDNESGNNSRTSINRSMNKILKICEEYCLEVEVHEDREIEETKINSMLLRFESCVECLLKLLMGYSKQECYPGSQHLSQFLLRLDYNSFFTQQLSSDMVMIYL